MQDNLEQIKLKLYGLPHEKNGAVRGDVFARKMTILIKGLRAADRLVNGRKSLNYLITNLKQASALAEVEEVQANLKYSPKGSSAKLFHATVRDISEGRGIRRGTPVSLAKAAVDISSQAENTYSHGEVSLGSNPDNVVLIDNFYQKRALRAYEDFTSADAKYQVFEGTSNGTFDGTLKEVDLRGTVARAKLILRAGGKEIDCICNQITVENLKDALDRYVAVAAIAHYNGKDRLPEQIDIKKIDELKVSANLTRWRGAFAIPDSSEESLW